MPARKTPAPEPAPESVPAPTDAADTDVLAPAAPAPGAAPAGDVTLGPGDDVELVVVAGGVPRRLRATCWFDGLEHLSGPIASRADLDRERATMPTCTCGRVVLWSSAARAAAQEREQTAVAMHRDQQARHDETAERRAALLAQMAADRQLLGDLAVRVVAIEQKLGIERPPVP